MPEAANGGEPLIDGTIGVVPPIAEMPPEQSLFPGDALDPADEQGRLAAVARMPIGRLRDDRELVRLATLAASRYQVPIAAITILDEQRQIVIARHGLDMWESPRDASFCTDAIRQPGKPLVVQDAAADPRFVARGMVSGPPHLRFYAGIPIVDQGGYPLGALCIADTKPHLDELDLTALVMMAHEVERRMWD